MCAPRRGRELLRNFPGSSIKKRVPKFTGVLLAIALVIGNEVLTT